MSKQKNNFDRSKQEFPLDFHSSKLPRVDICSLQSLEDIKEGFIHTPNYPKNYQNELTCVKKVPKPDAGHR